MHSQAVDQGRRPQSPLKPNLAKSRQARTDAPIATEALCQDADEVLLGCWKSFERVDLAVGRSADSAGVWTVVLPPGEAKAVPWLQLAPSDL
jgi:hypothetical protein